MIIWSRYLKEEENQQARHNLVSAWQLSWSHFCFSNWFYWCSRNRARMMSPVWNLFCQFIFHTWCHSFKRSTLNIQPESLLSEIASLPCACLEGQTRPRYRFHFLHYFLCLLLVYSLLEENGEKKKKQFRFVLEWLHVDTCLRVAELGGWHSQAGSKVVMSCSESGPLKPAQGTSLGHL